MLKRRRSKVTAIISFAGEIGVTLGVSGERESGTQERAFGAAF